MKGIARGLVTGLATAGLVLSCMKSPPATVKATPQQLPEDMLKKWEKRNLIDQLWVQIRTWRHDAGMELDPAQATENQYRNKTVKDAKRVCPDGHVAPKTCNDTCVLAEDICDNAETICTIADELGKNDPSQEKCTSAKASCREAKQRCCDCDAKPAPNGGLVPNSMVPAGAP